MAQAATGKEGVDIHTRMKAIMAINPKIRSLLEEAHTSPETFLRGIKESTLKSLLLVEKTRNVGLQIMVCVCSLDRTQVTTLHFQDILLRSNVMPALLRQFPTLPVSCQTLLCQWWMSLAYMGDHIGHHVAVMLASDILPVLVDYLTTFCAKVWVENTANVELFLAMMNLIMSGITESPWCNEYALQGFYTVAVDQPCWLLWKIARFRSDLSVADLSQYPGIKRLWSYLSTWPSGVDLRQRVPKSPLHHHLMAIILQMAHSHIDLISEVQKQLVAEKGTVHPWTQTATDLLKCCDRLATECVRLEITDQRIQQAIQLHFRIRVIETKWHVPPLVTRYARHCWECQSIRKSMPRCGQCKIATFCSEKCQLIYWEQRGHREKCGLWTRYRKECQKFCKDNGGYEKAAMTGYRFEILSVSKLRSRDDPLFWVP